MIQSRTHNCNELRIEHVGKNVTLVGWFETFRRISKHLGFLVLRDFYGTTQIVIESEDMMKKIGSIQCESTISVKGTVRERISKNPNAPTGDIEVVPTDLKILGKCRHQKLPFEINHSKEADENTRLKYRYLDLRNPEVKSKMILRSKVITELRNRMIGHDFVEMTTPILTASSPEGARDYLVPSRKHPGKFYALPQAPQQFKQLLMVGGLDRYFQIAPCFRDEDARADRSPGEFYQLDMEMAFASQEDVFAIIESVLPPIFESYGIYNKVSKTPFPRISYQEAIERYGTDKPDLRINLILQEMTEHLSDCGFEPFDKQYIHGIVINRFEESRKFIDKISKEVEVQAGTKVYWFKVDESNNLVGGIAKYLEDMKLDIINNLGLKPGDFIALTTGISKGESQKKAGVIRKIFGSQLEQCIIRNKYEFCWIVDFPMYETGEESGKIEFCHNPFSMPQGGMKALLEKNPLDILAYQYDLICNGVELSSGAVRNHDPEIMVKAFEIVGLVEDDVKAKFPALYHALCYGAPPHAGIAPGVDRMIMLLSGEDNIREIIPFPMNKNAQDVMMGAPSYVEQKQLEDVHIGICDNKE